MKNLANLVISAIDLWELSYDWKSHDEENDISHITEGERQERFYTRSMGDCLSEAYGKSGLNNVYGDAARTILKKGAGPARQWAASTLAREKDKQLVIKDVDSIAQIVSPTGKTLMVGMSRSACAEVLPMLTAAFEEGRKDSIPYVSSVITLNSVCWKAAKSLGLVKKGQPSIHVDPEWLIDQLIERASLAPKKKKPSKKQKG